MLRSKTWITIFMCSLMLFIAFSVSTGSAHAASKGRIKIIHTISSPFVKIPLSEGPPGCDAVQLGDYVTNVNYAGSNFIVENYLIGWYTLAGDEQYHFCDQITCVANVDHSGGKFIPAGIIGAYCGPNGSLRPVTKRTNPQGGGDGITKEAAVSPGNVTSCAEYWIGGSSGPSFNTGGGCTPGQTLRQAPATL